MPPFLGLPVIFALFTKAAKSNSAAEMLDRKPRPKSSTENSPRKLTPKTHPENSPRKLTHDSTKFARPNGGLAAAYEEPALPRTQSVLRHKTAVLCSKP